jgi:hypothetical protein
MARARWRWDVGAPWTMAALPYDRDAWWTVAGLVGMVAGLGSLSFPWFMALGQGLYAWALHHFLWTNTTLAGLEALIMAVAAAPFILLGTLAQCVHRLGTDASAVGRWQPAQLAWMAGGAGAGLMLAELLEKWAATSAATLMPIGAVPVLVAAMVMVWQAAPRSRSSPTQRRAAALIEPETGPLPSTMLHIALAVTAAALVSAALTWVYVLHALDPGGEDRRLLCGGWLVVCIAAGMGRAFRRSIGKTLSASACGVLCTFAGAVLAAGAACFSMVTRTSDAGFLHTPGMWVLWALCACVPLAVAGWALGGCCRVLLARSPDRLEAGAGLLQIVLLSICVAFLAVALVLLERLGSYATLVAIALALVATGGTLIIHDPASRPSARRWRLAGVFASVIGMIILMPEAGRRWLGHQQHVPGPLFESWWITHELGGHTAGRTRSGTPPTPANGLVDWYQVRADCRIGVVSLLGDAHPDLPPHFQGRVDQWAILNLTGRPGAWPALRALRTTRDRYDVLIIALDDSPDAFARRLVSDGLLAQACTRLSPEGLLLCVLPPGNDGVAAAQHFLPADAQAAPGYRVATATIRIDSRNCVALIVDRGSSPRDRLAGRILPHIKLDPIVVRQEARPRSAGPQSGITSIASAEP